MADLGTYTEVGSADDDDNDDVDATNYMDYVPRIDIDENSETLPRQNTSNNRSISSPPSVELSSLFRPKDTDNTTDEQVVSGGNHHRSNSRGTSSSLFSFEDSEIDSSPFTPTRKNDRPSYQQIKRKTSSLDNGINNNSAQPTSLSSIIERQQRRGKGVWGIMKPKKSKTSPYSFLPGSTVGELSSLGSIREEDNSDDEDDEDPLMEVMDYLEDEIDEYTYDELIPLQIRMALEDQIFGWDHFLSSILGHVGYTVGSYLLTFWFITFLCLREVPWGEGKVDDVTDTATKSNPWGMPHGLFSFIRTAISLFSAISTFRTIRRRRRVWLHPSRGDERRKTSLEEADQRARRFVLGSNIWSKMRRSYQRRRDRYLARGVSRKLRKAEKMFERRIQLIRSTSASSLNSLGSAKKKRAVASALTGQGHESSHHERVRILASSGSAKQKTRKRLDSDYSTDNDDGSIGGESSHTGVQSYHNYIPGYVGDSHTLPNFAMESVSHDQMPFSSGEIKNVPYVHGGFFGAAPFMLTNPFWIKILRILMPDVYVEIARRASYAPAPKLIHWAENNPVVAAYGTAHEVEFSGKVPTLEWDVFLDPYLVRRVEIVLSEKEAFVKRQKDARKKLREANGGESNRADGETSPLGSKATEDAAALASSDARLVLSYYDKEIRRRTEILVDRMLIAHGNIAQLVMEQTGYFKKYNFSRVKRTRKTLGGGIFARQWIAVYAEAMRMGMGGELDDDDDDEDDDDMSDSRTEGSIETREDLDFGENDFTDTNEGGQNVEMVGGFNSSSPEKRDRGNQVINKSPDAPPDKIVMKRKSDATAVINNIYNGDDTSTASDDESSPRSRPPLSTKRHRRNKSLGQVQLNPTSLRKAAFSSDMSIKDSISMLKPILQCSAPLGILMDMKSRHVPKRVWALVIDYLRDAGARVEGVASFIVDEIRDISQYCGSPVNEIVFIHSAGDLQHGCHTGQIKRRDRVFFNAGSLLWDYPNMYTLDTMKNILCHRLHPCFDENDIKESYRLKAYARTTKNSPCQSESEAETCDESTVGDGDSLDTELFARLIVEESKRKALADPGEFTFEKTSPESSCSTIQDYKEHYQLSIGLYVQEFAVDEVAISLIVKYVNSNPHVYDLGLSWGGINGLTVKGIQPGRFTATDGLWNQRYGGMPWIKDRAPSDFVPTATTTG
jgi:hypothetical protein